MSKRILDIEGNDKRFFELLDHYSNERGREIYYDYLNDACTLTDLIRLITRMENEILLYDHMFHSNEKDVDAYILSDVCGGLLDMNSPAYKKYVFDDEEGKSNE